MLDRLADVPALCPQFHISVQSGCDRILKAMHRHYSCAEFETLAAEIRKRFPNAALTTDIMTGFPGETDEDHAETMEFVQRVRFAQMHVFRYSPRPGTKAADAPCQVPERVKKLRADALAELGVQMRTAFLESCVGRTVNVLFERERGNGFHQGHAENYASVRVPDIDGESRRGLILPVKITGVTEGGLVGEIVRH